MRSPFRDFPFSDRNHRVILSFLFLIGSDSSPGVDGATTQPGAFAVSETAAATSSSHG
jgi:hypothetical protein